MYCVPVLSVSTVRLSAAAGLQSVTSQSQTLHPLDCFFTVIVTVSSPLAWSVWTHTHMQTHTHAQKPSLSGCSLWMRLLALEMCWRCFGKGCGGPVWFLQSRPRLPKQTASVCCSMTTPTPKHTLGTRWLRKWKIKINSLILLLGMDIENWHWIGTGSWLVSTKILISCCCQYLCSVNSF